MPSGHGILQGAALELDIDHVAAGVLHRLLDCHRHLARLTAAKADLAIAVTDNDESSKTEDPATLDCLGDAVYGNQLLDELDHKYLNDLEPFKKDSPSSENISRYLFERLSDSLNGDNVTVERVNVWESDNACASYTRD